VRREALAFAITSADYWGGIFREVRRERDRWRRRALAIPDPVLRADALATIEEKWGHSEGAAAFAVLVPRKRRRSFVRMAIAYQLMIDYLDTISERPVADPWANTLRLHGAAEDAVTLGPRQKRDYYLFHSHREDAGFLLAQIRACGQGFAALPSIGAVGEKARSLTALYAESQCHCHAEQAEVGSSDPTPGIDRTAGRFSGLRLGEALAACNTSIPIFALMAEAAWSGCTEADLGRCLDAYFPWVASLHILLHSLVDEAFDLAAGKFNQMGHYKSKAEAAEALEYIATRARAQLLELPQGEKHLALLGGMVGYYLSSPAAWEGEHRLIAEPVLRAIGPPARWSMATHRTRRRAEALAS